jgi:hypothetical protein
MKKIATTPAPRTTIDLLSNDMLAAIDGGGDKTNVETQTHSETDSRNVDSSHSGNDQSTTVQTDRSYNTNVYGNYVGSGNKGTYIQGPVSIVM